MAYDEGLAERIREVLAARDGISEKKMFGGIAFMLNGNMCCGVVEDRLMVRVGPDAYEDALSRPHAREMDFTGRPMKGFVYVDGQGTESDGSLKGWVDMGLNYAKSLPIK